MSSTEKKDKEMSEKPVVIESPSSAGSTVSTSPANTHVPVTTKPPTATESSVKSTNKVKAEASTKPSSSGADSKKLNELKELQEKGPSKPVTLKSQPKSKRSTKKKCCSITRFILFLTRLFIYYLIYLAVWKCPPSSQLDTDSPRLCHEIHSVFRFTKPYTDSLQSQAIEQYNQHLSPYMAPYIEQAKPYTSKAIKVANKASDSAIAASNKAHSVVSPIVAPYIAKSTDLYHSNVSPIVAEQQKKFIALWNTHAKPHVDSVNVAVANVWEKLSPHYNTAVTKSSPYLTAAQKHSSNYAAQGYAYSKSKIIDPSYKTAVKAFNAAYEYTRDTAYPLAVKQIMAGWAFVGEKVKYVWFILIENSSPKIKSVYYDKVEPQIAKVVDRIIQNGSSDLGDEQEKEKETDSERKASEAAISKYDNEKKSESVSKSSSVASSESATEPATTAVAEPVVSETDEDVDMETVESEEPAVPASSAEPSSTNASESAEPTVSKTVVAKNIVPEEPVAASSSAEPVEIEEVVKAENAEEDDETVETIVIKKTIVVSSTIDTPEPSSTPEAEVEVKEKKKEAPVAEKESAKRSAIDFEQWRNIVGFTTTEAIESFLRDVGTEKLGLISKAKPQFTRLLQALQKQQHETYTELVKLVNNLEAEVKTYSDDKERALLPEDYTFPYSSVDILATFKKYAEKIRIETSAVRKYSQEFAGQVLNVTEKIRTSTIDTLDEFAEVTLQEIGRELVAKEDPEAEKKFIKKNADVIEEEYAPAGGAKKARSSSSKASWKDWKEYGKLKERLLLSRTEISEYKIPMQDINEMLKTAQDTANILAKETAQFMSNLKGKVDHLFIKKLEVDKKLREAGNTVKSDIKLPEEDPDVIFYEELEEEEKQQETKPKAAEQQQQQGQGQKVFKATEEEPVAEKIVEKVVPSEATESVKSTVSEAYQSASSVVESVVSAATESASLAKSVVESIISEPSQAASSVSETVVSASSEVSSSVTSVASSVSSAASSVSEEVLETASISSVKSVAESISESIESVVSESSKSVSSAAESVVPTPSSVGSAVSVGNNYVKSAVSSVSDAAKSVVSEPSKSASSVAEPVVESAQPAKPVKSTVVEEDEEPVEKVEVEKASIAEPEASAVESTKPAAETVEATEEVVEKEEVAEEDEGEDDEEEDDEEEGDEEEDEEEEDEVEEEVVIETKTVVVTQSYTSIVVE